MPKGTNPTHEELEFIFDLFSRGLSDVEVREELQGTEFPLRDLRTIRKYRMMYDAKVNVGRYQQVANPMAIEAGKRHHDNLMQAIAVLKNHMESVAERQTMFPPTWEPTDMDQRRVDDLLSHLQNPELEEAYQQTTKEPTSDARIAAAKRGLDILRDVLLRGITGGNCASCPETAPQHR